MTLIIILAIVVFIIALVCALSADEWDGPVATFLIVGFIGTIIAMFIAVIVSMVGYETTKKVTENTYPVQLASLNDGTGVEGKFRGGLFISRGYIADTQHYSYYAKNPNGSFNLQKRPADASTIWQDATPETARVDITDRVTTCEPKWWMLCDKTPKVEFARADFHVPEGSIGEEYRLDAQ